MNTTIAMTSLFAFLGLTSLTCTDDKKAAPEMTVPTRYSKSGYDLTPLSKEKIAEIVKTLTPDQVKVTQDAGT